MNKTNNHKKIMDKESVKFRFTQDVANFIKSHGTAVWIGEADVYHYNIPEWFKSTEDESVFEVIFPDQMTSSLKKDLRIEVELYELQEKYNTLLSDHIAQDHKLVESYKTIKKLEEAFRELLKSYLYNAQPTHQGADIIKWIEDHRNHWEIKAGLKEQ